MWPYQITRGSDEAEKVVDGIKTQCEKILEENGIKLDRAVVRGLRWTGGSRTRETLILATMDEDFQAWKVAATVIQEIVDKALRKQNTDLKIKVEIRNELRMYKDVSTIIPPNTPIQIACEEAQEVILNQVQKSCPGNWTAILYHMRGPRSQENDRKPTIMVCITPKTRSIWGMVEREIEEALQQVKSPDINLHVEVLPGQLYSSYGPVSLEIQPPNAFIYRKLSEIPNNGASIGPRGAQNAGSLGTFVDFQPSAGSAKIRCLLTCYHVIAPGDPTHQIQNDTQGICLEGKKGLKVIRVDYPAHFDGEATRKQFATETAQGRILDEGESKALQTIIKNNSTNGIGSVIHASGKDRLNDKAHRMDWALVRLDNQNAPHKNKPPPENFSPIDLWNGRLKYDVKPEETVSKIGMAAKGEWAAKIGRTSAVTVGEVNSLRGTCNWSNGRVTKEIEIGILGGKNFASTGDSGSMVLNIKKEWIGMICQRSSCESAFITSAQEIIEDVKEKTGGIISLP